ncbi:MAG TPA: hypothetical protein VN639_12265, partial [Azonexus sp.]|nr:hypothetical protein [Azonexus sp.]
MPSRKHLILGLASCLVGGFLVYQWQSPKPEDLSPQPSLTLSSTLSLPAETSTNASGLLPATTSDSGPEAQLAGIFKEIEENRLHNALQLTENLL